MMADSGGRGAYELHQGRYLSHRGCCRDECAMMAENNVDNAKGVGDNENLISIITAHEK